MEERANKEREEKEETEAGKILGRTLGDFFLSENIDVYASLPIGECTVSLERKLPDYAACACFFLIPYYFRNKGEKRNISLYAVPRDYHGYIKELSERFGKALESGGTEDVRYTFFADNSPFDERKCAERAQLGVVGKNRLLLSPKYGSYVFLGCVVTDTSFSIAHPEENFKHLPCENCENCSRACPKSAGLCSECLSALTQKKKVSEKELSEITALHAVWGCDICQTVCPCNRDVPDTPIAYFRENRLPYLTEDALLRMSDEEFRSRAFAWRGRETILRNLRAMKK